jgi:predicted amidohydrolase YtcJ
VQPSFVPTDMRWIDDRITEPWQYEYCYAWKTLLERSVIVAGGSDSPVEHCNPFIGIYDAMMRVHRADVTAIFRPSERLNFATALGLYTLHAAYAAGCEATLGSLEAGFAADIVFINAGVMYNPPMLRTETPNQVMVGGQTVYEKALSAAVVGEAQPIPLQGPFIPGKNGMRKRSPLVCLCCNR